MTASTGSTGFVDLPPRLREVLYTVAGAQEYGTTWREISRMLNLHHGQASGALSSLHRKGFVARLTEKRDRCSVYVANRFVLDRDTLPYPAPSEKPAEASESDDCDRIDCRAVLAMYESLQAENARLKESRDEIVDALEKAQTEHWEKHLKEHPYADEASCPRCYAKHEAYSHAISLVYKSL